jgi:hypothetical protein
MATLHLAQTLLRKAVVAVTYGGQAKPTQRLDKYNASQMYAWFFSGPDVVFTDPDRESSLSIGAYSNAWFMDQGDFDCVINCCPTEGVAPHTRVHCLNLADTDDVSLDDVRAQLDTALADVRQVLATPRARVLCHCSMGASRSVAVAIYLLCRIYGHAQWGSAKDAFLHYYGTFKRCRPCINVSVQLMREVCRLLAESDPPNTPRARLGP